MSSTVLICSQNCLGWLKTVEDVGRLRLPREGTVTKRSRDVHGHGTKTLTPLYDKK